MMSDSKTIKKFQNRNAVFEVSEKENTIRKNYFSKAKNERELLILKKMQRLFTSFKFNNWTYKLVETLGGSKEKGILMKIIPGVQIMNDNNFSDQNYYHAGVWLGYFHSLSFENNNVKAFGDFSFSNVFIDYSSNTITAMDPSGKGMSDENYYFDILMFFKVAFLNKLKKIHPYSSEHINLFLKGYIEFGFYKFDEQLFNESLDFVLKDFKASVFKRYPKIKALSVYYILKFHLKHTLYRSLKKI